jgi:hypothetical protein
MEQHSSEWYQARLYKFTSSQIYKLMVEPRESAAKKAGELGETAKAYVLEKIAEQLGGFIPDLVNEALAWGTENEPKAKYWYEKLTGYKVEECGFIQFNEFYGGSPDAKVIAEEGEGSLEIKCPYNSANHLKHCLIDGPEYFKQKHSDYYWQCVSHMITQNTSFCHFVSFDPRIDNDLGFFIIRIDRDEEECSKLLEKIEKAEEYKKSILKKFNLS